MQIELKLEHSAIFTAIYTTAGDDVLAGLVLMWCLADEAQIIELAVHPKFRRQGIGLALMTRALAEGSRSVNFLTNSKHAMEYACQRNVYCLTIGKFAGFLASS